MKQFFLSLMLAVVMIGSSAANAAGLIRLSVDSIMLTQNGYGVATRFFTKYHTDETACKDEAKAYSDETSVQVGGKQVYTLNKAKCEAVNQSVNQ